MVTSKLSPLKSPPALHTLCVTATVRTQQSDSDDIYLACMYESRNFLEPNFSPDLPRPEHPTLKSSGLWAAPGTLSVLPGGLVRKRLMSLPPAVRKSLAAALDRFGALLGDTEGAQLQPHPLGAGSPSKELVASCIHSKTGSSLFHKPPPHPHPPAGVSLVEKASLLRSSILLRRKTPPTRVQVLSFSHIFLPAYSVPDLPRWAAFMGPGHCFL